MAELDRDEIAFHIFRQFLDPKYKDPREVWEASRPEGFLEAADNVIEYLKESD